MKNIAFIITKSEVGGAQTWVNEISNLVKEDNNIFLITSEHGWLTERENFSTHVLILPGLKKYFNIISYVKLTHYIRINKIDIVIASSANAGIYARLARLLCNFKCIYVSHGWSCLYNGGRFKKIFCGVEKYLSLLTDVIWCISEGDRRKALDLIKIKNKKIKTLTNSVPKMPRNPTLDENRNPPYKIIFVGRLTHPKRADLLAEVISERMDFQLDIVGGGEQLLNLEKKFGSCENIKFLGEVFNFSNYCDYDLFALISESEGLPMSALEAHTAGIPLLLSNVGGCFELIENNGMLVENNKKDINDKLDCIVNKYEYFKWQAEEVADKFIIDNYIKKYRDIILN